MIVDTSLRKKQLNFFKDDLVIKQDQELIELITNNHYTQAIGIGEVGYFSEFVNFVDQGPVNFCIYIQTKKFNFDELISRVNNIIDSSITSGGLIYLSLNKYLAVPGCYDKNLPADYDQAIEEFVKQRVHAKVERYQSCGLDGGNKFNWIHPLTRFYLRTV